MFSGWDSMQSEFWFYWARLSTFCKTSKFVANWRRDFECFLALSVWTLVWLMHSRAGCQYQQQAINSSHYRPLFIFVFVFFNVFYSHFVLFSALSNIYFLLFLSNAQKHICWIADQNQAFTDEDHSNRPSPFVHGDDWDQLEPMNPIINSHKDYTSACPAKNYEYSSSLISVETNRVLADKEMRKTPNTDISISCEEENIHNFFILHIHS